MTPETCPFRDNPRDKDGKEWADCSAEEKRWGRALPVLRGTCEHCVQNPAARAAVVANFDEQLRRRGRVVGEDPPSASSLADLFPPPPKSKWSVGPVEWAVGVLTAPRKGGQNHLPETLASMAAAGWPDPLVFAEPGAVVPDGVRVHRWPYLMGCLGAGINAVGIMHGAYENRRVQAFLLVEDDVRMAPGTRRYLDDHVLWPPDAMLAGLNLFLSSRDANGPAQWLPLTNPWGGQALLFRRDTLGLFLQDPAARNNRHSDNPAKSGNGDLSGLDIAVQRWARRSKRHWWIARGKGGASLISHRLPGDSSIWDKPSAGGDRVERVWAGDLVLNGAAGGPQDATGGADDLAAERLARCRGCKKWSNNACRCNGQKERVDETTVGNAGLKCPLNRWRR